MIKSSKMAVRIAVLLYSSQQPWEKVLYYCKGENTVGQGLTGYGLSEADSGDRAHSYSTSTTPLCSVHMGSYSGWSQC